MLHKQTPTARMFVNADEFIKKKYTRQHEIGSYKSSRQLRVSACQGWLRNRNRTLHFRHFFLSSVYNVCFLSLVFFDLSLYDAFFLSFFQTRIK